jgi:YVTN family beta-propeller protein
MRRYLGRLSLAAVLPAAALAGPVAPAAGTHPAARVYVVNANSGTVSVTSAATDRHLATIRVGYNARAHRPGPVQPACCPGTRWPGAADEALHTVGLAGRGDDKIGTFSKGMQQRPGLGVAPLGEPAPVVLDEPTSALDPVGRHDVRVIIRELRDRGTTVFLNTHLLAEAEHVCDRVTIITKGRSLATGTLDELKGGRPGVRLRVAGLPHGWWRGLAEFGRWAQDGDWLLVEDMPAGRVPDLVSAIVSLGGRVEAVIPERTLEERFLELPGEP